MAIFSNDALRGKHALITGATGGIGQETAIRLVSMGASVTLTGRNQEKLNRLRHDILQMYPSATVHAVSADITKPEAQKALVAEAERHNGPISLLVNNAGTFRHTLVEDLTEQALSEMMDINFTSAVFLTQQIYLGMKERREGAIVNVSSLAGLRGLYGYTAYAASKAALISFTHCLALEAIKYNVRVNAVCPGFVDTEMGHDVVREAAAMNNLSFEEQLIRVQAGIPSGRATTPSEVANTIAFLLTDAAGNIVGELLKISGGALLR